MSLHEPRQPEHKKMDHGVADLPSGPLDIYRKKASFSWKDMLLFIEGEEILVFKVAVRIKCSL